MVWIFPHADLTLTAGVSVGEAIARLEAHLEPPRMIRWGFSRRQAPYEGRISDSEFEIRRIIHYRNSFLPLIRGRFEPVSDREIRIQIRMELHPVVAAIAIPLFLFWMGVFAVILLSEILSGNISIFPLFFVGVPLSSFAIFWWVFRYEVNRSTRELTLIFSGQPLPASGRQDPKMWVFGGLLVLVVTGINLTIFANGEMFFPTVGSEFLQPSPTACSGENNPSPDCDFSVFYTLDDYPTEAAIAISADHQILATGGEDKAVKIWNLETGKLKNRLQSDSGIVTALAIAPDGKTVVSGGGDRIIRIWDLATQKPLRVLTGHAKPATQIVVSSDGKTIVSANYEEMIVWDFNTGELKVKLPEPSTIKIGKIILINSPRFYPITISPDGKTALIEIDGNLTLWDWKTDQKTIFEREWYEFQPIRTGRISPDGKTIATTSYRQPATYLKLWDRKTGQAIAQIEVSDSSQSGLYHLALTRDRIIGSTHQGLKIWNLQTAQLEATLDAELLNHLVASPGGEYLAGIIGYPDTKNTKIQVWQRMLKRM